jgi:glycosyltransferase involved in cell wall biosynthesis
VLLRNALHFLRPFEREEYLRTVPGIAAQIRLVHAACRRADLIVTPTHDMADRVSSELPHVASRILVRPHPLTFQPSGRKLNNLPDAPFVLSPALSAAHKDSAAHLRRISAALGSLHRPELVAVTAQSADLPPDLQADSRIRAIGPQPVEDMADWYACSSAIYFPTSVESFGYPLAEARAIGRAVIAIDSQQNREVAGDALCGYSPTSTESFRKAVETALAGSANSIEPDPNHFDRAAYFDWLLSKATNG